jgi:hypothetical protein
VFRNRWLLGLIMLMVLLGACAGDDDDETATTSPETSPETSTTDTTGPSDTTDTTAGSSTTASSATTTESGFTVAALGRVPERALGTTPALGSGCAPGTDLLPDGVWFGWVTDAASDQLGFDLACLWPGRREPAASNDATRIRQVPVSQSAQVFRGEGEGVTYSDWAGSPIETPADNAPGLSPALPYWLFVNDGAVTEIAQYPDPIRWVRSATAWPDLYPGCCDAGDVAPPSPADPWPSEGWPADGFYAAVVEAETADGYDLEIHRWLTCDDAPALCPDYWVGDEVVVDPDQPSLLRRFPFDETTMVVITPIFSEGAIVGDGTAFGELLADLRQAITDRGQGDEFYWADPGDQEADPDSPFGMVPWPDGTTSGPIGYRGPGGSYLTPPAGWWTALEIRNGEPVLYIDAGIVAG